MERSHALSGNASSRVSTSNPAKRRYGSQAANTPTLGGSPAWPDFRSISTPPVQSASHSARGGNSHGSPLGTSQPRLATGTTMARPINAPSNDGNSGPRNPATSTYGTVSANEANNANGHTANPSQADLFLPKNRVMNTTSNSGISVPTMACSSATLNPTKARKPSHCPKPMSATAVFTDSSPAKPLLTPTRIGVPTAPNDTGVLWIIIPATTAAIAGKPSPTISGTVTAAGVPNPAAPSINAPNSQAMMMTCTRRSAEMLVKPLRMTASAPLCLSVFSSRIAPKMMNSSRSVSESPLIDAAATCTPGTCQTNRASPAATRYETGIARLAGKRKPTSRTPTARIGRNERSAVMDQSVAAL